MQLQALLLVTMATACVVALDTNIKLICFDLIKKTTFEVPAIVKETGELEIPDYMDEGVPAEWNKSLSIEATLDRETIIKWTEFSAISPEARLFAISFTNLDEQKINAQIADYRNGSLWKIQETTPATLENVTAENSEQDMSMKTKACFQFTICSKSFRILFSRYLGMAPFYSLKLEINEATNTITVPSADSAIVTDHFGKSKKVSLMDGIPMRSMCIRGKKGCIYLELDARQPPGSIECLNTLAIKNVRESPYLTFDIPEE